MSVIKFASASKITFYAIRTIWNTLATKATLYTHEKYFKKVTKSIKIELTMKVVCYIYIQMQELSNVYIIITHNVVLLMHLSDTARGPWSQLGVSLVEYNTVFILLVCQPCT